MDIPFDLLNIVASYLVRPKMKILDWLDKDKLNWSCLTENPGAIDVLEKMLKQQTYIDSIIKAKNLDYNT